MDRTRFRKDDAQVADVPDPARDPIRGIVAEHRRLFELGRQVARALRAGARSKSDAARQVARDLGIREDRCLRALDFFDLYDEPGLERLGRIRTRDHEPLGESYLFALTVADPEHREALLRFLEERGRTRAELLAENQRLRGEQLGPGGMRPRPARTLDEALDRTIAETDRWLKVVEAAWPADAHWLGDPPEGAEAMALSPRLAKASDRLRQALELAGKVGGHLECLRGRPSPEAW